MKVTKGVIELLLYSVHNHVVSFIISGRKLANKQGHIDLLDLDLIN